MEDKRNNYQKGLLLSLGFFTIALAVGLALYACSVLLLIFAAILIAVLLSWPAAKLSDEFDIPYKACVAAALLGIILLVGGIVYLSSSSMATQVNKLLSPTVAPRPYGSTASSRNLGTISLLLFSQDEPGLPI